MHNILDTIKPYESFWNQIRKKRFILIGLCGILYGIYCLFFWNSQRGVQLYNLEEGLLLSIKSNSQVQSLLPWKGQDGIAYFFLPSGVENKIYFDKLKEQVFIDGKPVDKWNGFIWEANVLYMLETGSRKQKIVFMKSENIPAIFISTESGSMNWIHTDKENVEQGTIHVFSDNGQVQYAGSLEAVSGRGNSTWEEEKKPYSITLKESYPLCGMNKGKSWKLLALYYEHDKIHSKITYDMAKELGLDSTPSCTWTDLYCNGEYQGLYLLTESKKRNLQKDANWLLEKTHKSRMSEEDEQQSFVTDAGYYFQAEMLQDGIWTDMSEVSVYIQQIEDLILKEDIRYKEYLNLDSLARKLLLEKIVMNYDAMGCSAYFVLDADGRLSAGPAWDYDNTFGTMGYFDYTSPIEGVPNEMTEWFNVLYKDEEFHDYMVNAYKELLPYLSNVLLTGIDNYESKIRASVSMDLVRWGGMAKNRMFIYKKYDNYIRYLKYFFANRLNYLNKIWKIEGWEFEEPELTGEMHTVTFLTEDGKTLEVRQVTDGTHLRNFPDWDEELYDDWYFLETGKCYRSYFPIYEDMTFCARKWENVF